ncbi:tRNA pseudouridine(55) synthase TruB [Staphylococcus condimenti]|uniref:tRNA pseudouridine synthase B n=2 Tax=Staphylococcus condimenti TaxID=70255 RepID=A0AB37H3Z2_9STAP|nr:MULTISPECIES: tRNA pseudouridine(55) synthase TruB [Staphylococcus]AMY04928.1 tRNA pseudouridine(55) synthase [Staphylococcus condimenti]APR61172.1 tRNA pseudouridine(55) synthase TruB [Staphylococcus condimenti]MDK8645025.1 tRNA pseudouridine(55) synthase TruB [Staphylococcus condimenti]OFP01154.1 tRNA pseudouridine(55) synthase [Staphylococcus sp. HMSC065E08]QQS83274.1 tRNA pseudouridine(55) synthase TruB [Staphylococcus condimenti]
MFNMEGILPVFKERGLTSHDVVFKLRKILHTKKVGHTGTLDPEVDGVLPVCIGNATKVSDYIMDMGKAYEAEVTIGYSTTTEDQTGEVLEKRNVEQDQLSTQEIDAAIQSFKGEIEQIPPMYSSVKVNGRKLYEYARNNETVERPKRKVKIYEIERTSEPEFHDGICSFNILIRCGKGTYIRTLATDIGNVLNYPAHMSLLTRIESGGFQIKDSLKLDEVDHLFKQESLQERLFPIEYGLKGLPHIRISNPEMKKRILNGQKFYKNDFTEAIEGVTVLVDSDTDKALALYIPHSEKPNEIKPKKVFN